MKLCSHHLVHLWHLKLLHSLPPSDEETGYSGWLGTCSKILDGSHRKIGVQTYK
jgi:hypothetical protein